jgi:predicted ATPase
VATRLQEHFANGVVFVSLAPLNEPGPVLGTLARGLGVTEQGSQPLRSVVATFLRHKHLLLVVDNFEQVAAAAPELAALLPACAGLRLLFTSRAPLHLQGESCFTVPPLALPDLRHLPAVGALGQVPAVALFVQRAQAVRSGFALTPVIAVAVAGICVRLDGLPLAIELAAAQLVVLPPAALLARLAQPLQVLTGGPQDVPARQQTLRNTIAWSYSLLSLAEQALFRRLSVFAGGATLEAIEAVCTWGDVPGDPLAGVVVLEGVRRLVHLHLMRMEPAGEGYPDGEPRFTMLETLREYGREQVEVANELDAVRRRHAMYFLTLADDAWFPLMHAEQIVWLARLEEELDNLRTTLGWCVERGNAGVQEVVERGMVPFGWLANYWMIHGHIQEGADWLGRLLAVPAAQAHTSGRAAALWSRGFLVGTHGGDIGAASALFAESVAIARALDDRRELPTALFIWGALYSMVPRPGTDDLARACALLEEAEALYDLWGDENARVLRGGALAMHGLALLLQGDLRQAEERLTSGLELARAAGHWWFVANGLLILGNLALARGDLAQASALLEESLTHQLALRNRYGIGQVYVRLGDLQRRSGSPAAARAHYGRALHALQAIGHVEVSHQALCGLAELAGEVGEPARALMLAGLAHALAKETGAGMAPVVQARLEQLQATAAQALSAAAQAAACAAGQTLPLEQVITEALADEGPAQQVD